MAEVEHGAPASGTGSREPDQQAVPALSGFDPSRSSSADNNSSEGKDMVGWIVGNGDNTLWRCWNSTGSDWTRERNKATRYARREDAEAVHAEDEDAWFIVPYGSVSDEMLSNMRDALEWALSELDGRTKYTAEYQRENCLDLARAALAKAEQLE